MTLAASPRASAIDTTRTGGETTGVGVPDRPNVAGEPPNFLASFFGGVAGGVNYLGRHIAP
jgi:hypothetical protein